MNQANRLVVLAVVAVLSTGIARAETTTAPSASELLQQVKQLDRAAAEAAVAAPDAQSAAARQAAKDRMIKELIVASPQSPDTIKFLGDRWRNMSMKQATSLTAELDDAIRDAQSDDVVEEAYIAKINALQFAATNREQAYTSVKPIADTYIARVPNGKYISGLYSGLAGIAPDAATEKDLLQKAIATAKSPQDLAPPEARLKALSIVGKPIDLAFTDAITGKPMSVAALKGKLVVLDFWATWCGPCVAEMPAMKKLYAEFKDRGVEFIGVSLDAPPEEGGLTKLREFCAKNEVPWPQYYQGKGWDADFSSGLGVMGVPTAFVLNKDGTVYTTEGRGQLDTLLPKLLGDQPATQPSAR